MHNKSEHRYRRSDYERMEKNVGGFVIRNKCMTTTMNYTSFVLCRDNMFHGLVAEMCEYLEVTAKLVRIKNLGISTCTQFIYSI
jgi:hypothetical protein